MKLGASANSTATYINQHKTNSDTMISKIAASKELSGADGANLLLANTLNSQVSTYTQQIQNENDKVGMLQIADGALQNINDNAIKLDELSIRYNSATLNSAQKSSLESEFKATQKTIEDIAAGTSYNNQPLFGQDSPLQLSSITTDNLDISNQESIKTMMDQVGTLFSNVGSSMQNTQSNINTLLTATTNAASSYAMISEQPLDMKINDLSANNTQLTASIIAQSHQTQSLQQQMTILLQ